MDVNVSVNGPWLVTCVIPELTSSSDNLKLTQMLQVDQWYASAIGNGATTRKSSGYGTSST